MNYKLSDFEKYLYGEGQRLNTVNSNRNVIKNFIDWTSAQQLDYLAITYNNLLTYIDYCKEKKNVVHTINSKLISIKHFYSYLQNQGLVQQNPAEELRIKGFIKRQPHGLLKWDELEQLYQNYSSAGITGKRNKMMLGMMIYQGLGGGELARIEVGDIKLEEGKVYIPSVGRSNSRVLDIAPVQILELQKYITQVRPVILSLTDKQSDKLFTSTGVGNRLDSSISYILKTVKKAYPLLKDLHQIRASVITHWFENKEYPRSAIHGRASLRKQHRAI